MSRVAAFMVCAILLGACLDAPRARSLDELRRSTFGEFATAGSALVAEEFRPMHYNIGAQGHICAELRRTFATNDADAFLASVRGAADVAHGRGVRFGSTRRLEIPTINDREGLFASGGRLYAASEEMEVTVTFFDLDGEWRPRFERHIAVDDWRFAVWLRVHDDCFGFAERFQ